MPIEESKSSGAELSLNTIQEKWGGLVDEGSWTALRLWVAMARAQAAIAGRDQCSLDRHGLTRGEFGVLDALFFKGPLLLGEIQRKVLVSSGGVTYLVDRLEKRGYVKRTPSREDRRAIFAALTAAGEAYFREIFPAHADGLAVSVSALSKKEQEELTRLLKKMGLRAAELLQQDMQIPRPV